MKIKLHEKTRKYLVDVLTELKKAIDKEVYKFVEKEYESGETAIHADAYGMEMFSDGELIDEEEESRLIDELLDEMSGR